MVIVVISKEGNWKSLTFGLRKDEDVEMVRQITDRLLVYLEPGVKVEFKAV